MSRPSARTQARTGPAASSSPPRSPNGSTADSNYHLDDPSPGTSYYADTRLVLGFERNTGTQTFALGLDTGLRALWEADQNFEFTVASPTGANLDYTNEWADGLFDAALRLPPAPGDDPRRSIDTDEAAATTSTSCRATPARCATTPTSASSGAPAPRAPTSCASSATTIDYTDENTNKVPRTTLEGQGTWNLQLNPVLAGQLLADYLHYQADNDDDTELANAELTAGLVYQPDENFQVERRARLFPAQALGHRLADRRPRPHPGQYRPGRCAAPSATRAGQHHLLRRPALHHRGARPAVQRQRLRAVYVLPRGQLSGRIFQNYTGTDSGGQEARVNGIAVGLPAQHQRGLGLQPRRRLRDPGRRRRHA